MAAACGTCAICLAELDSSDEAFLDGCFHHFHLQCVERWAAAQQEQAAAAGRGGRGGGPSLACPLCRRPFESAIYDCHDSAYRRRFFGSSRPRSAAGDASSSTGSLALTAAHRRRRATYASPLPEQQRQGWAAQRLSRVQVHRQDVPEFVTRELQALLLQQDVGLVAQHVVGTLQNAAATAGPGTGAASAAAAGGTAGAAGSQRARRQPALRQPPLALPRPGSAGGLRGSNGSWSAPANGGVPMPDVVAKLQAAAAPFLFEQAERFAWEVAGFAAASGCSVAAYDRQVQQADAAAAAAAGAEARQELRLRQQRQRQAVLAAQQGGAGGSSGEQGERQEQQQHSDSSEGGPHWDGRCASTSSSEGQRRRQRSPEAERSDSEGYLGLLMAQVRSRRRPPQDAMPPEVGQPVHQAQQAEQAEQQREEQPELRADPGQPIDGSPSSSSSGGEREGSRDRRGAGSGGGSGQLLASAAAGQDAGSNGSGSGEQAELLAALRQQALQALAQHRAQG